MEQSQTVTKKQVSVVYRRKLQVIHGGHRKVIMKLFKKGRAAHIKSFLYIGITYVKVCILNIFYEECTYRCHAIWCVVIIAVFCKLPTHELEVPTFSVLFFKCIIRSVK